MGWGLNTTHLFNAKFQINEAPVANIREIPSGIFRISKLMAITPALMPKAATWVRENRIADLPIDDCDLNVHARFQKKLLIIPTMYEMPFANTCQETKMGINRVSRKYMVASITVLSTPTEINFKICSINPPKPLDFWSFMSL